MRVFSAPFSAPSRLSLRWRRLVGLILLGPLIVSLGSCSFLWWGKDEAAGSSTSVFDLGPGDCTVTPADITVEVTKVDRVDCSSPHQQEVYATVTYVDPATKETPDDFPGNDALKAFADGSCAEAFTGYVGVDYRDSRLFYTYLLPSARGWEQNNDHRVVCFVTTTGEKLTRSVKNTEW